MKLRELRYDEVTFVVVAEPDDCLTPHGNVQCSEDEEDDRRVTRAVLDRLEAGDYHAWCILSVRAEWRGFSFTESVGAVSLAEGEDLDSAATREGMKCEALAGLNEELARMLVSLSGLMEPPGIGSAVGDALMGLRVLEAGLHESSIRHDNADETMAAEEMESVRSVVNSIIKRLETK